MWGGGARQRDVRGEIYWCLWTHQLLGGGKTMADRLGCVLSASRAQGRRGGQANKRRSELKKCNRWFVLEGMSPPADRPCPAVPCPPPPRRLTPLPRLTPWASPLTGGLLSRLSPGQAPCPRAQPSAHSPPLHPPASRYHSLFHPSRRVSRPEARGG